MGHDHRSIPQIEAGQVIEVGGLGQDEIDVGVIDVAQEVLAHPGSG